MTSPVPSVSPVPVSGHSGWPVNRTLDDQPWLTQQPIGGVSFSWGSAAASRRISGVTVAGDLESAGDLLWRLSASAELADTFQQFIIGHSTMIVDLADIRHPGFGAPGRSPGRLVGFGIARGRHM